MRDLAPVTKGSRNEASSRNLVFIFQPSTSHPLYHEFPDPPPSLRRNSISDIAAAEAPPTTKLKRGERERERERERAKSSPGMNCDGGGGGGGGGTGKASGAGGGGQHK